MTQIAATDDALIRLLEGCDLPGVTVMSAPHSWDSGYIQRLLTVTPAVLVAFVGAEPYADTATSTTLALEGKWSCIAVTGWNGADQKARRLGAGAGLDLLHRAAAAIHGAILKEPNGDRLPISHVEGIEVRADSATDIANLWIGEIAVSVELPLELMPADACYGPLDDFLKIRGDIDLPDPADDIDIAVDIPQ